MEKEKLKELIKERPVIGCFVNFPSGDIAEMTARIGFDFILIDNEHGVMEPLVINDMIRSAQFQGASALVRCPEATYTSIQKMLDMGADGIQIPLVNTSETAKKVHRLSKYPPEGTRGMSFNCRAAEYGMCGNKLEYRERVNKDLLNVIQIETLEAIENLDEILKVPGIDVLFVGPGDLSTAMGYPDFKQPEVKKKVEEVIRKIAASGKIAGVFAGDVEFTKQTIQWGARYIVTAIAGYMVSGGEAYLRELRS